MAVTQYCTLADVKKQLSVEGVDLRLDDNPALSTDVLDWASLTIDEYCLPGYTAANLAASGWIKRQCALLAAFEACGRRNNPAPRSLQWKVDRLLDPDRGRLEMVRRGSLNIPDVPRRVTSAPSLSNVRVRLDPVVRTVVEKSRGTSTGEGYRQHTDRLEWFDPAI